MPGESSSDRVHQLVRSAPVVLFMKGVRQAPRCGFSASTVEVLDRYLDEYVTIDVLEDPELREEVKRYSEWPTIPQLFVEGEFIGGADIVRELESSGEIVEALGSAAAAPEPANITLTSAAASVILDALADQDDGGMSCLRVTIDARFNNDLALAPPEDGDLFTESQGVRIAMDRPTARRARGLVIDYVDQGGEQGFKLDNPNAPVGVQDMSVAELKVRLDRGDKFLLVDVRTVAEREIATIPGAVLLDDAVGAQISALPPDAVVVFHCHHGGRSLRAAQALVARGYRNVYNLVGGIDAWSAVIDPSVPRY